jgi:uncharacterized damage-inducible protein DinB
MKELLKQYAAFNSWANQKLQEVISGLPEEKLVADLPSSFRSIRGTLLHMWDAESIWWQRIKLQERTIFPSENFNGTTADICNGLTQQDALWLDWVSNASEAGIEHVIQYYNSKKEYFKQPVFQVTMHVFNHNTYHRGQLINMFRQLGVEKLPATDFVVWTRKK